MEALNDLMNYLLSKHHLIRAGFFASSIFCLRQSVKCLLLLHRSASPIFRNTQKLNLPERLKLFGATMYVTFFRGKEIKEQGRDSTFENETSYVSFFRGLEYGGGIYHHEELLDSNKASVWVNLCMTSALYSFFLTLSNFKEFPNWSAVTTTIICISAIIQTIGILCGYIWSFFSLYRYRK